MAPGVLDREEIARRILTLPPAEQAAAAAYALELYGPGEPEGRRLTLHQYVREAWPQVEPGHPFVDNWHIGVICEHLEAVSRNEIRRLVINIPPRHTKSLTVSVMWPSWEWTFAPWVQWLYAAYAEKLSKRDSLRTRRLIRSPWYQRHWGHVYQLSSDQSEKLRFENDRTGYRIATSVGGAGTGEGGDRVVVDDPHKAGSVDSDTIREGTTDWWDNEMSTRANDPQRSAHVIIMQRLHEGDLTGHVLEQGGYVHLRIPARYEARAFVYGEAIPQPEPSPVEWEDPRTEIGEPLWPERFGDKELKDIELRLGSYGTAGQLQQRPSPAGGGILHRVWWRFWVPQHSTLPPVTVRLPDGSTHTAETIQLPIRLDRVIQSWDMAFKGILDVKKVRPGATETTRSYTAGQTWGAKGAQRFLLDATRRHAEFTEALEMVRSFRRRWQQADAVFVEDKANGPAIISTLRTEIPGLVAVDPEGDKVARLRAVAPQAEAGQVYLPHPALAPWVWDFIEELATAPHGQYNDQADAFSQALRRLGSTASVDPAAWPTVRR